MSTVPGGGALARQDELENAETAGREFASSSRGERGTGGSPSGEEASKPAPPPDSPATGGFDSGPRVQAASQETVDPFSSVLQGVEVSSTLLAGARDANERLLAELGKLRQQWTEQSAARERLEELSLERDRLRAELAETSQAAAAERAFFIEEQDRFLSGVLEEHEQALLRLTAERDAARTQLSQAHTIPSDALDDDSDVTAPGMSLSHLQKKLSEATIKIGKLVDESERSRELLRRLRTQRDDAQEQVTRLTGERDKVQAELFALQAERLANQRTIPQVQPPSSYPPPAATWQGHAPLTPGSGEAASLRDTGSEPEIETQYPDQRSRPLKQKPSPTETPLGAYSLASEELTLDPLDIPDDKRDR
jgi:hypothetical protein